MRCINKRCNKEIGDYRFCPYCGKGQESRGILRKELTAQAVYTKEKTTKQNRIQPPARLRARGYLWALLRQNSRRWQLWQSTKKNITALMLATA